MKEIKNGEIITDEYVGDLDPVECYGAERIARRYHCGLASAYRILDAIEASVGLKLAEAGCGRKALLPEIEAWERITGARGYKVR